MRLSGTPDALDALRTADTARRLEERRRDVDEAERFSSVRLAEDLTARGIEAITLPDADQIATTLALRTHPHDVVAVLSNGGFDGVHRKLLDLLGERFSAQQ